MAELDVVQPHIEDGLQGAQHVAVAGKQLRGFADGEVQHIGHVEANNARRAGLAQWRLAGRELAVDGDFQNLRAVALAVAVWAAQVNVAQELHLDMLKA